jgi:hypothetical protein
MNTKEEMIEVLEQWDNKNCCVQYFLNDEWTDEIRDRPQFGSYLYRVVRIAWINLYSDNSVYLYNTREEADQHNQARTHCIRILISPEDKATNEKSE